MAGKKEKRIKKRKPAAGWVIALLKLTQHISVCIALFSLLGAVLMGSIYVRPRVTGNGGGYREMLFIGTEDTEDKIMQHLERNLYSDTWTAIRLATIRSQLETNGVLDLSKQISVSDYYYRRSNTSDTADHMYFDAVYTLEDLLRWEQAGGLKYLNVVTRSGVAQAYEWYEEVGEEEIAVVLSELTGEDISAITDVEKEEIIKNVDNMFLTVDGKRLEDIVYTNEEYKELCNQLAVCMSELHMNYEEYQTYIKGLAEGKTSFVYYIDMDNDQSDVFTNLSKLQYMSLPKVEDYFETLVCAAMGTTSLYGMDGNFALDQAMVSNYISDFEYAFGNNAVVYTGYDTSLGVDDFYGDLVRAYETYDEDMVYVLIGIAAVCGIYYLILMLYFICQSGKKVDAEGNAYTELIWFDGIYTEVFAVWILGLLCIMIYGIDLLGNYINMSVTDTLSTGVTALLCICSVLCSMFVTETTCSLSRRLKAKTIWKNSLCYRLIWVYVVRIARKLREKVSDICLHSIYYMEHAGLWERTWGIFLVELVFFSVGLICMYILCMARENELALCIGIVLMAALLLITYKHMRGKTERMLIIEKIQQTLAGENVKVDTTHLSMDNAALGEAVNEIGEGMHKAVERSIKDERLKAELLTNVSHDIKTPLTSIINYVDLLKKEPMESEKAVEYIQILDTKSQKLKTLIQDLIEASKISSGNIEYEMVPLKLHELMVQMIAEYEDKFQEHCLKVVYDNTVKDAVILADSRRMWRVMENLFSNIYKYASEGTRVYIEVTQAEDEILAVIKNISAKEINIQADKLTERFVRGDTSRNTEGGGLGLAIAQSLVVGQGGTLQILLDGDLFKVILHFKIQEV